jgi:hypothetical protein
LNGPPYIFPWSDYFEAIVTSTITLTEVLVYPLRQGDQYSCIRWPASHRNTLAVSAHIAIEAAPLRANWGYKTQDAIQLATAQSLHAAFFVTSMISGCSSIPNPSDSI